jgi:hypothetical protein
MFHAWSQVLSTLIEPILIHGMLIYLRAFANGRQPRIPYLLWRSVHGSGRIFRLLNLTRLAPIPGSLSDQLGVLFSITAFLLFQLIKIMPQKNSLVKPNCQKLFLRGMHDFHIN